MKVFTSCVAQKYGEIKADISQINELSFDATFDKWKELTQGEKPALDVYRGYSWEFITKSNLIRNNKLIYINYSITSRYNLDRNFICY